MQLEVTGEFEDIFNKAVGVKARLEWAEEEMGGEVEKTMHVLVDNFFKNLSCEGVEKFGTSWRRRGPYKDNLNADGTILVGWLLKLFILNSIDCMRVWMYSTEFRNVGWGAWVQILALPLSGYVTTLSELFNYLTSLKKWG